MTEAEFLACYKQTLSKIEEIIENAINDDDADIDYESGNDMLTMTFSNNTVAIISRQSAICQLWLAAKSGGFHFDYDAAAHDWVCTVNDKPLGVMLQEICSQQGGISLSFK